MVQTVLYVSVLYFMAYFAVDAGKFFWFMLFSLLTFLVSKLLPSRMTCHIKAGLRVNAPD